MYTAERPVEVEAVPLREGLRRGFRGVGPNVWFLGLTSLLTDASSEMVASVLPVYLVLHLGISPLGYGVVDGLQHAVTALVRLAGGALADRRGAYKEIAFAGYAVSAACRLALLPAGGSLPALAAVAAADRMGKGLRTAPRDALVSLSSRPESLGVAFGVHRSLDALGALLGPVVAFALLASRPDAFRELFVVSFLVAVAGVGALLLLVRGARPHGANSPARGAAYGALLRAPGLRGLVIAATALGFATVGDGFLYLVMQRRGLVSAAQFPLLFVATSACYFALAAPAGRLADRFGRRATFLAGHALLVPAYAAVLLPVDGLLVPALGVVLLGAYYAATDGVAMALAASWLAPAERASGLALVATASGLARFAASIGFGILWTANGEGTALAIFAGLLVLALFAARAALRPVGAAA